MKSCLYFHPEVSSCEQDRRHAIRICRPLIHRFLIDLTTEPLGTYVFGPNLIVCVTRPATAIISYFHDAPIVDLNHLIDWIESNTGLDLSKHRPGREATINLKRDGEAVILTIGSHTVRWNRHAAGLTKDILDEVQKVCR